MIQKRIPWNKGLKLGKNPEHSKRMRGRRISDEHKRKISMAMKGKIPKNLSLINANKNGSNNPAWRGGLTSKNYRLRRSNKFKLWRESVYKRDDYTCQICSIRGSILNPHHLDSFGKYKEKRFDPQNGITLCATCHQAFHKLYGYQENNEKQFKEYRRSGINTGGKRSSGTILGFNQ